MKHESGCFNNGGGSDADSYNLLGMIDHSISPAIGQENGRAPESAIKDSGGGKSKVIPLGKGDIKLCGKEAKKKRIMTGLVVLLSIVLAFIILPSSGKNVNVDEMQQDAGELPDKNVITKSEVTNIWKVPEKISDSIRDVTSKTRSKSEFKESSGHPQLMVRGIVVYSDDKKSAIIGDMIVKVGDTINGVKIYMINADSVVFEKDGMKWTGYVE